MQIRAEPHPTRHCVSQGSTVDPPQFLNMINDLRNVMTARYLVFDDFKLFSAYK